MIKNLEGWRQLPSYFQLTSSKKISYPFGQLNWQTFKPIKNLVIVLSEDCIPL